MLGCCGQREIKVKSGVLTHLAYIYLILARGRCPNRARATLDPGAVFRATAAAVGLLCCENGPRWRVEPLVRMQIPHVCTIYPLSYMLPLQNDKGLMSLSIVVR